MKFEKFDKHASLVNQMSATLGIDMVEEATHGRIPVSALRSQVLRCMNCKELDACESFLASHTEGADAAPDYCENRDVFASLLQG